MSGQDHVGLWNRCLEIIRDNVPEQTYKTWFLPIVPLKYEDKTLVVQVPSQFFYEFLEDKFVDLLRKTLYKVIGEGTKLMYNVMVDKSSRPEKPDPEMFKDTTVYNFETLEKRLREDARRLPRLRHGRAHVQARQLVRLLGDRHHVQHGHPAGHPRCRRRLHGGRGHRRGHHGHPALRRDHLTQRAGPAASPRRPEPPMRHARTHGMGKAGTHQNRPRLSPS